MHALVFGYPSKKSVVNDLQMFRAQHFSKALLVLHINAQNKKNTLQVLEFPLVVHPNSLVRAIGLVESSCAAAVLKIIHPSYIPFV